MNQFNAAFGGFLWVIPFGLLLLAAWSYYGRYKNGLGNPDVKGTMLPKWISVTLVIIAVLVAIWMWNER